MLQNVNQPANKETLAQWVSLLLRKALSESNIKSGFRGAGIYPINHHAVDEYLTPSKTYAQEGDTGTADREGGGEGTREGVGSNSAIGQQRRDQ